MSSNRSWTFKYIYLWFQMNYGVQMQFAHDWRNKLSFCHEFRIMQKTARQSRPYSKLFIMQNQAIMEIIFATISIVLCWYCFVNAIRLFRFISVSSTWKQSKRNVYNLIHDCCSNGRFASILFYCWHLNGFSTETEIKWTQTMYFFRFSRYTRDWVWPTYADYY